MTAAVTQGMYRVEPERDQHTQRIVATTTDGTVIAGAYRLNDFNAWHVFVSKAVADAMDVPQPHKSHVCSRQDAVRWLDMLATLYTRAMS